MNIPGFAKRIAQFAIKPTIYHLYTINCVANHFRYASVYKAVLGNSSGSKLNKYNVLFLSQHTHSEKSLQLSVVEFIKETNKVTVTEDQALLVLRNCGKAMHNETPNKRFEILDTVWEQIKHSGLKYTVILYNTYIEMCTENNFVLDCSNFLSLMKCEPNQDTYMLLLANVCEKGDLDQASALLTVMKNKKVPIDTKIFDCLVLGNTVNGGLHEGEGIIKMMRSSSILESDSTVFSLFRGLIIHGNYTEFEQALQKYALNVNEQQILQLLYDAGINGTHLWLPEIMKLVDLENFSRNFMSNVENICISLIHCEKAEVAILIYESLIKPSTDSDYAASLIKEMLNCGVAPEVLVKITCGFKESGKNPYALESALKMALEDKCIDCAWVLLENLSYLRQHFFWPLLLNAGRETGELGIFDTLSKMHEMKINADAETLQYYCLPFCDLTNPKDLLLRIQSLGYTVRELLTAITAVLLNKNRIVEAQTLCDTYKVRLQGDRLLSPLARSWKNSGNIEAAVKILQKICESGSRHEDWTGQFLQHIVCLCKTAKHFENLLITLKLLHKEGLYICPAVMNTISGLITRCYSKGEYFLDIQEALDNLLDLSLTEEPSVYLHPRYMNIEQLECHLVELENKNMETRGVLRRLIQQHTNCANLKRVEELQQKFLSRRYGESPGIKASRMHSYVQSQNLTQALDLYHEIKSLHPEFRLDSFKILDLSTLMVSKNLFQEAVNIIKSESEERNIRGGPSIERNCRDLLNAAAEPSQSEKLLELLCTYGYCKPSNVMLGLLIRAKLKSNLKDAAEAYVNYCKEYKCTPLKVELLRALLEAKENELFEMAVKATESVYGTASTNLSVIAALAEQGMEKSLRSFLLKNPKLPKKDMVYKQYDYWVHEKRLLPLLTISRVISRLNATSLDPSSVHLSIMKVYSESNDCENAVLFWGELEEEVVTDELRKEFYKLLKRCKYDVPQGLNVKMS